MSRIAIIGRGRLGTALAAALRAAGRPVEGPLGRDEPPSDGVAAVLLCVPDAEIARAAALIPARPLVGHCSGATPVAPHCDFGLHPLMTVTEEGADFRGAGGAIAGSSDGALAFARGLAGDLGLNVVGAGGAGGAADHAAAAIAAGTLERRAAAAGRLRGERESARLPLVRATVENWARLGPERALTGPVARGDEGTVARQRDAVEQRAPELLPLFDAMVEATRVYA